VLNLPPSALPESLRVLVVPHPSDEAAPRSPSRPAGRRKRRLRTLLSWMHVRPVRSVERNEPVELPE